MEEMVCKNLYKVGNLHVEDFTSRERGVLYIRLRGLLT
jgi:hypothetical protein